MLKHVFEKNKTSNKRKNYKGRVNLTCIQIATKIKGVLPQLFTRQNNSMQVICYFLGNPT